MEATLGAVGGLWLAELTLPSSFAGLLAGEAEPPRGRLPRSQPVPWGARLANDSRCSFVPTFVLPRLPGPLQL